MKLFLMQMPLQLELRASLPLVVRTLDHGSVLFFPEYPLISCSIFVGIILSSGFASVFTEKVIKSTRKNHDGFNKDEYSLAYMQAQLALVSLILLGVYSFFRDFKTILEKGFFWNYDAAAFLTSVNSAVGGLIVAASLKFADSVLKGYASACSIILTGVVSSILFGTELGAIYIMGVINVCIAVLLYNADSNGMDAYLC